MDIKIHNDDINIIKLNHTSASRDVSPVQKVMASRNLSSHGNSLPSNTANSGTGKDLESAIDADLLDEAVNKINRQEQVIKRELHFSIDKDSGKTVIKVMDLATNEVIRQIPIEPIPYHLPV